MTRIDPDFFSKCPLYKTAELATHVFTNNGDDDLSAGTIVGVSYIGQQLNQMHKRDEPVFAVTLQGGRFWGHLYANALDRFVL